MKGTIKFLILFCVFFLAQVALAAPIVPGSFSTTWNTNGDSDIFINLGACPTAVYWEEIGNSANNGTTTSCNGGTFDQTVTFPSPGEYRTDFSGSFTSINLGDTTNKDKFRTVEQWGNAVWSTMDSAFYDVNDLVFNATDVPNLSNVTSMEGMFYSADNFNSNINNWDVSNVTNMTSLFHDAPAFNQPLNNWDVSNVTTMQNMLWGHGFRVVLLISLLTIGIRPTLQTWILCSSGPLHLIKIFQLGMFQKLRR